MSSCLLCWWANIRAEPNDTCKQMSVRGCHIFPFLSFYTNTSALDLEGLLAQHGELIFWATSSSARKARDLVKWCVAQLGGSMRMQVSPRWQRYRLRGKSSLKSQDLESLLFIPGNKAEHPQNLRRWVPRRGKKKQSRAHPGISLETVQIYWCARKDSVIC